MWEYKIYADRGDGTKEYAGFEYDGDYVAEILRAVGAKACDGTTENQNAAKVVRAFVAEKIVVKRTDFKRVMRALRHFDEVGLSNELYDVLEELSDESDVARIAFAAANENVSEFTEAELSEFEI